MKTPRIQTQILQALLLAANILGVYHNVNVNAFQTTALSSSRMHQLRPSASATSSTTATRTTLRSSLKLLPTNNHLLKKINTENIHNVIDALQEIEYGADNDNPMIDNNNHRHQHHLLASRRTFLSQSIAAITLLTITTNASPAWAATDNIASSSAVTPSFSEGELTISNPPPNRARVIVDADDGTVQYDENREGLATAATTTTTSAKNAKESQIESKLETDTATDITTTTTTTKKKPSKKASDPRFFVAGGLSAAISHGITTPIDVVKTRMQSDATLGKLSPQQAAIQILQNDGPSALSVGLGPTVVGYGIEGALKFGVYESLKPIFLSFVASISSSSSGSGAVVGDIITTTATTTTVVDPTQPYLAAAICAGALASLILCPMEETRIRLVTDPSFGSGLLDGLPKLLKEEGILAPFSRGILPMLSKQVPYTMGKQVSFDVFAGILYGMLATGGVLASLNMVVPQQEVALGVEIGAAFMASVVACLVSHPGDVLLTATYKNNSNNNSCDNDGGGGGGFGATISQVYNEGGGLTAFFRGLSARFFHVGCIITFQLVLYDQVKQFLGLPASGVH